MRVSVVYNSPVLGVMCSRDGLWLVTTHGRKIVKAQRVEDSDSGPISEPRVEEGGIHLMDALTPFSTTLHSTDQGKLVDAMLAQNTQWLVRVTGHRIARVFPVSRPVALDGEGEAGSPVPEAILSGGVSPNVPKPRQRKTAP